ncbi:MAG: peptidylprolyl isomerase [Microcystaceae cyanobacterium]
MTLSITITSQDILTQVKLSYQIPDIIKEIIIRKVITSKLADAGIKIEAEELQKAADITRLTQKLKTPEDTFLWLDKYGLSLDNFEDIMYFKLSRHKLAEHLFAQQIEPYFFAHQLDYAGAIIYEVILDDEDLALELFYAISEEEITVFEVAKQYIEKIELQRKVGYRGFVKRQEMKPEISAAIFSATSPQLLKPIITAKGVHLILVEEIIQPQLTDQLRSQILADLFEKWLQQQIEETEVIKVLKD